MKRTVCLAASLALLASCGLAPYFYDFSILDVTRTSASQDGAVSVSAAREPDSTAARYLFSDSLVDIRMFITTYQVEFTLKNKTAHTIALDWEKAAYVNPRGERKRVIHRGIVYAQKEVLQHPTLIYKAESLSDILLPSDNVMVYLYGSGGWSLSPLFSSSDLGKTAQVIIPVEIGGVMREYVVRIKIKSV